MCHLECHLDFHLTLIQHQVWMQYKYDVITIVQNILRFEGANLKVLVVGYS
jgi:hypothetical protein